LNPSRAEIDALLASLANTPREIARITKGLSEARLRKKPAEDLWSASDILAHLRSCADVWGKSILQMLHAEHPTIRYVSPRTWMRKTKYPELGFQPSLSAFAEQRADLLRELSELKTSGWSRGATFTATTRGREGTVFGYATKIWDHERGHLEQLRSTVK